MTSAFSDALAPLAARLSKGTREIEVLRVAAQLDGADHERAFDAACRQVLAWIDSPQRQAPRPLPPEAWALDEFDLDSGGRDRSAVRIKSDDADIWALRADDPDKEVAGRIWTTEVVIADGRTSGPSSARG